MLNAKEALPLDDIRTYCLSQPIKKLSVFGSILRDDFKETSDVDMLIEFEPTATVTYFDLFDIKETLSELVQKPVDLLTPSALSPYFHDDVLTQAVIIYERE